MEAISVEKTTLLTIGEALIDFIPDRKACSFDDVTAFSPKVGGAPANVCAAYARLGGKAKLLTQLGDDPFGHKILHELQGYGIDTRSVVLTREANTALAFVTVGADGSNTYSFYRNPSADMLYTADHIHPSDFDDAYALHFCSVSLGDFPMKSAHKTAIAIQRGKGGLVSFDVNLRFPLWEHEEELRETVEDFLPLADIVKVSDDELRFLTDEAEIPDGVQKLFTGRVQAVLVTCGADGAYAFNKAGSVFRPAQRVNAVDTTGAGDGFIGAFLWKLRRYGVSVQTLGGTGEDVLSECLDFANAFCAKSVQAVGAMASYPTIDML